MNRLTLFVVLFLATASAALGQVSVSVTQTPSLGGLRGIVLDRPAADNLPHGLTLNWNGQFAWGTAAIDATHDYPGTPDLVLAYSRDTNADNLRLRSDDARMELGPKVGHPVLPFQFTVSAGTAERHLGGVAVGTYGYQYGLYLFNRGSTRRNVISFQNLWSLLTDSAENGVGDFTLYNQQTQTRTITVSPINDLTFCSPKIGFYAAPPVSKPSVAGSWSDGSAAKNVLAALVALGLVTDITTP